MPAVLFTIGLIVSSDHTLGVTGMWLNKTKWLVAPSVALLAMYRGDHLLALAAITWPLACMFIAMVQIPVKVGIMQDKILRQFTSDPAYQRTRKMQEILAPVYEANREVEEMRSRMNIK